MGREMDLNVVAQEADQDDGQRHEDPVLPGLEGVVPVVDHARRVEQVQALVEDVARADVVHAQAHQDLARGVGAPQVVPPVGRDGLL